MFEDDKEKPLTTRTGTAQGKSFENREIAKLGGPDTIRKDEWLMPDGSVTRVHTRGPGTQPEVITEKQDADSSKTVLSEFRTFVFNTYSSVRGVVANYRNTIKKDQKVGFAWYFVAPFKTKVGGILSTKWNDVWRLDSTWDLTKATVNVNGQDKIRESDTGSHHTIAIEGAVLAAIPFYATDESVLGRLVRKYRKALTADNTRSPLFIGSRGRITSFTPTGVVKEYLTPSYSAILEDRSSAGLELSDDGIFTQMGGALQNNGVDYDTIDAGMFAYSRVKVLPTAPYMQEIAKWADGTTFGPFGERKSDAMKYSSEVMPEYVAPPAYRRGKTFYYFPDGQTWPSAKYVELDPSVVLPYTGTTGAIPATFYEANTEATITGAGFVGSIVPLYTTLTIKGKYTAKKWSGSVSMTFENSNNLKSTDATPIADGVVVERQVYTGREHHADSNCHTELFLKTTAVLPEVNLLHVTTTTTATFEDTDVTRQVGYIEGQFGTGCGIGTGWYYPGGWPDVCATFEPARRVWWGQTLLDPNDPNHPENASLNAAAVALVDSYAPRLIEAYESYPLNEHKVVGKRIYDVTFSSRSVDYVYADIDEEVFIYLVADLTFTKHGDGTTESGSHSLSASFIVDTRFGSKVYPVATGSVDSPGINIISNFVRGDTDELKLGGGIGNYHANYVPIPLFSPVFMEQGNCPWVSYTTKAEEFAGTAPEIHIDMTVLAAKYSNFELYAGMRYTGTVAFIPHQFLHIYQRYLKQPGPPTRNYGLWGQMFGTATRIEFTNVGGPPMEFSEDIKLHLTRI